MTLKELKVGESAAITHVGGEAALRQHFLDMGLIPGTEVTVTKLAPMGDPMELQIHGYALALRLADAARIDIAPVPERSNPHSRIERTSQDAHPGLGESGKYHAKGDGDPLPDSEPLTFALVGNQNCGKTTLFNRLTGANQHVGNFPGVTVDRRDGVIRGHANTVVTDLPGIYSMSPYSSEEVVSRNFVLQGKPRGIINIVDATNIERNLYLSMQLLEMNIPMVIALNMMDEVRGNNGAIDINRMEALLGVPVVPISAAKDEGVDELVEHALHVAKYQEKPLHQDLCSKTEHGGAIHRAIHAVESMIEDHAEKADIPLRFAATKALENDPLVLSQLGLDDNERQLLDHIAVQMESESGMDRCAAMADMRFDFIERVCESTVVKPKHSREYLRSEKIDRILTGKWTAIPVFIIIMFLTLWLTFDVIGPVLQDLLAAAIGAASKAVDGWMEASNVNSALRGLVTDGIFEGVGSVLSFLPIVVTLFLFLSLMEDSGYIARVAFFMDKLLRRIGLSGRSIVPLLIGFGCTVPAVMATRTLSRSRDRKMTILLTPFMSCSAKLPVYGFFVSAFFAEKKGLIMAGLYFLGIFVGVLAALLFKNTLFRGEAATFVLELPNYRMPSAKNVLQLLWEKAKDFITRAFSIILVATIIVWVLQQFDTGFNLVSDPSQSILAQAAGLIAPLFAPLGLGDWRVVTSLISGFIAKESVVATMEMLFTGGVATVFTASSAAVMLAFSLLYTPCVAAVASIKREMGGLWAIGVVVWQCAVAWGVAFIVKIAVSAFM